MKKFKLFSQKEESTIIEGNKFNNKLKSVKNKIGKKIAIGTLCALMLASSIYLLEPVPVDAVDNDIYVTVEAGDTLSAIADQYNISYEVLAEYNDILDPNNIEIGQVLKIPNTIPECSEIDLDLWDSKLEKDGYVKGIDLSFYQDDIDLENVIRNNDINAVISRAAYFWGQNDLDNFECDDCLDKFGAACRDNNVAFGIYYFPTLANIERTEKEANIIIEKLKDLESKNIYCTLPIFLDIEAQIDGGGDLVERLGNRDPEAIKCFNYAINLFRENGYEVMLYTNGNCCSNYGFEQLAEENNVKLWLAQYPTNYTVGIEQNPIEDYGEYFDSSYSHIIRQYADTGNVIGYESSVDLDLFYENIPKYIIENGLNHTNEMNNQENSKTKQLRIVKIIEDLYKK